jgi:hypothetical protein
MWGNRLDNARRRLRRGTTEHQPPPPPEAIQPGAVGAVDVAFVRSELDRFIASLAAYLDPQMPRPDSPARLAGALTTAIDRLGGKGRATVVRSPAGLYTPEYWHVRIDGADDLTRAAIARLVTGGRVSG